jgi:7-carboxy-7-deazaguanine synthase
VSYQVKEIFFSLQGEGALVGRPAVFCRFAGCNLWTGLEVDRPGAVCNFCDTDFVGTDGPGGGSYRSAAELAIALKTTWPSLGSESTRNTRPYVVCTGGEPLLQMDTDLIDALHGQGFEVAVETNGTLPAPAGLDWICVSPKAGAKWVLREGDELKLVFPQADLLPDDLGELDFRHLYLQPMDGPNSDINTRRALQYCLANPRWRLSLQVHKILGID